MAVMYLAFYQGAIGPLTWLVLSEIFLIRLRGMGLAVFCLWISNFLVGLFFPVLLNGIGISATFIVSSNSIFGIFFVMKLLPETRGRLLEQIEHNFKTVQE